MRDNYITPVLMSNFKLAVRFRAKVNKVMNFGNVNTLGTDSLLESHSGYY
jgi:hypothetical protein